MTDEKAEGPTAPEPVPGPGWVAPGAGQPPGGAGSGSAGPGSAGPGPGVWGDRYVRDAGTGGQGGPGGPGSGPGSYYCYACGRAIDPRAEICPGCGVRQPWSMGALGRRPRRDRIVAALLAIFLGDFGIHKFYLGHTGLGILYLLFFWTGIPGLIGLIEGILYLIKSDEQWAAEYGDGAVVRTSRAASGCLIAFAIMLIVLGALALIGIFAAGPSTSTLSTY